MIGEIQVGSDWDDNTSDLYPNGLRYVEWELHSDTCGPGLRSNNAGKVFLDLEETPELDVDEQAAADFLEFIASCGAANGCSITGCTATQTAEALRPRCVTWLSSKQSCSAENEKPGARTSVSVASAPS